MAQPVTDVKLEKQAIKDFKGKDETAALPIYHEELKLSDEQKERVIKEICAEMKAIREERDAVKLDKKFDTLDNQYEGKARPNAMRMFNLNQNITKVKIDNIAMAIKEALFDSDPMFAVSPRPEYGKTPTGPETCLKQQDFLDYKLDTLPFEPELDLVAHSAALKGIGWLEIYYDIVRENRRREEYYEAKLVPALDDEGKPLFQDGLPLWENKGLTDFLRNWPNAQKDYPGLVTDLAYGKDITFVANYKETVYNDPRPKYHDPKNVFVRLKTNGYEGLKTTKLIGIKENFSYWELKQEEKKGKFYDIDKLVQDEKEPGKTIEGAETKDFDIIKATFYFKINPDDEEETKVIIWINEEKKLVIGSCLYSLYAIPCNIIPFYVKRKLPGMYQPGVAEDLTDTNLAESALLNIGLEGAAIRNTVTPITDSPTIQSQFLEKRFSHGVPIEGRPGEIDFLQKYMAPIDIQGLISLTQFLKLGDDAVSRVSSGMSGAETPFDPSAPATKTIALLRQSGRGVSDYIRHFLPSFNEIGYILLSIYYQMSKEGREYAPHPERVVAGNPFATITREEMAARTNIEAQAYAFEQDKVNEKALDLSLFQTVRMEPLIANNPDAVYVLLKNLVDGWSKKWKNIANRILPTLEDLKKKEVMTAIQGVSMYAAGLVQQAKVTGVKPEIDPQQLMAVVNQLESAIATPPPEPAKNEQ